MADYDVTSLKDGIKRAYENIKIFEEAIQKERDTINEYKRIIDAIKKKKAQKN